jgi:error-prone DNA polymerase
MKRTSIGAHLAYAELQTTTNFSFLRGGSHGEELVATAKTLGLAGLAITDRNTLAGVVRAYAAAKEVGLRLIVGARLDLTAPSFEKSTVSSGRFPGGGEAVIRDLSLSGNDEWPALNGKGPGYPLRGFRGNGCDDGSSSPQQGSIPHKITDTANWSHVGKAALPAPPPHPPLLSSLLCLPTDRAAYGRLSQLLTLGQRRAEKGQCTLFLDDVIAHSAGQILIALQPDNWNWRAGLRVPQPDRTPCATSDSANLLAFKHALPATARLYLAASHAYRGDDRARISALAHLAEHCGIPLVATGDVLYHAPHRRPLQDVLTCIREKCTLTDAGFRLEANAERHLKSPAEMARLFTGRNGGHEDALARTSEILQACRFSLDELVYEYPDEPVPPDTTPQSHLEALTWAGAAERYPPALFPDGVPAKIRDVLAKELGIIAQLAYAPYFLTVHDIVRYARSQQILCQGRGSAANSAVCYCLGITNVNPIEVDLLFERFITPERKEPPDIDVDFEHERREEVIQYIYRRYGRERAGLAATVISYRSRSAVREVGKAMGLSQDTVAALAGMVWGSHSGDTLPEKHVREAGLDPADPRLARVLELTRELTGFPRHLSQHVGGFVLTRSPLSTIVPIGNAAMENRTCIEWDKDDLDSVGLLKVDVLGLGMLSCIRRAFDLLAVHHKRQLSLATVPREDSATYDMLCRADSIGVFQVESRAQMNMLPRLKPRCFYDLVIEVAIVRPGPIQGDMVHPYLRRRDGLEPEHYPSPDPRFGPPDELRQILGKTKGVPLFQEQAMRIAMEAAKFTPDETNLLRKALATFRRRGTVGLLEEKMVSRMVARGYDRTFAERCFNQIKGFGEYGFPESHAASFAHLVYVSAWLKCHYPEVFAAALLNSQPMGFYAPAQIVRDAIEHGVEARAADVNFSDWDCTLEEGFRFEGLGSRDAASLPETSNLKPKTSLPLRLGLRQIDGLRQDEVEKIVAARGGCGAKFLSTSQMSSRGLSPGPVMQRAVTADESNRHQHVRRTTTTLGEMGPGHKARDDSFGHANGLPHGQKMQISPSRLFTSIQDLWARAGVQLATLERLAAADAFRSLGLDRRQALWEVKALGAAEPLPLFGWHESVGRSEAAFRQPKSDTFPVQSDFGPLREPHSDLRLHEMALEESVELPAMSLSEHVVADYQTTRLSLKAHPMSFLRERLTGMSVQSCATLKDAKDGARVAVAGIVLVRQRPGSAKGVVFMTIEDETGIANAVVWPKTLERFRKVVMGARLVHLTGRIQSHDTGSHDTSGGKIIHVVAQNLEDRSDWLALLSDDGGDMPIPVANADEVVRPEPGSARGSAEAHARARRPSLSDSDVADLRRHPRDVRVIPKSRDFH